jgi:hypothetical protein
MVGFTLLRTCLIGLGFEGLEELGFLELSEFCSARPSPPPGSCFSESKYAPILAPFGNVPYRLIAFRTFTSSSAKTYHVKITLGIHQARSVSEA